VGQGQSRRAEDGNGLRERSYGGKRCGGGHAAVDELGWPQNQHPRQGIHSHGAGSGRVVLDTNVLSRR
jgi:hypothetical protein